MRNVLICTTLLLSGCAFGSHLTRQDIEQHGTRAFQVSNEELFAATLAGLRSSGFDIAVERQEKGLIKTDRRVIGVVSSAAGGNGYATAQSTTNSWQIVASVSSGSGGRAVVALEPRLFTGEQEISKQAVWDRAFMQQKWSELFREIEDAL